MLIELLAAETTVPETTAAEPIEEIKEVITETLGEELVEKGLLL